MDTFGVTAEKTLKIRGTSLPAAVVDGLSHLHAEESRIYKYKLRRLKKFIKNLVLENAALCDAVAQNQNDLLLAYEERQQLLRKVMQMQVHSDQILNSTMFSSGTSGEMSKSIGHLSQKNNLNASHTSHLLANKGSSSFSNRTTSGNNAPPTSVNSCKTKKQKCTPLPLNSSGRPILPLNLGQLTIHSLGEVVVDSDKYNGYHCERSIYPVGFCSSRYYANPKNPNQKILYTCTIKEDGKTPRFEVACEGNGQIFSGSSPTACHSQVLRAINEAVEMEMLPTETTSTEAETRALRFFGLTHPTVQNMIQSYQGARKCEKYKWVLFEVCKTDAESNEILKPEQEASICYETLLRNIRFAGVGNY